MNLYEVHTHLYGCLDEDDLNWLGSRKPPRWEIYKNSFYKLNKAYPNIEFLYQNQIFQTPKLNENQKNILRSYYVFDSSKPKNFLHFQLCFDFIIALSHTDPEELKEIALRVFHKQKEYYSEYRMMFSPKASANEFKEKTLALIEGFKEANKNPSKISKLIISLNREYPNYEWQYQVLKEIQKEFPNDILVGIDFAGNEENDSPINKFDFIETVKKDKQFVLLYHVGEILGNKTPASTVRWILWAHQMGVHRIGHAVALAYDETKVANQTYIEHTKERLDHLMFLAQLYEIENQWIPIDYVKQEIERVKNHPQETIEIFYKEKELKLYLDFLNFCVEKLKRSAIIESCPTSNLAISGFSPLPFFEKHQFCVCLGADDPSIFNTSLEKEFQIAKNMVENPSYIEQIKKNNQAFCSINLLKMIQNKKSIDS